MSSFSSPRFDEALRLHQAGQTEAAEAAYLQVLAAEPNHPGALHLVGVIRLQQGRHEEALELIGRAIDFRPNVAVYHSNFAAALLSLQRFAEAKSSLSTALKIRPNYADALSNLGMAEAALGNEADAIASLRTALTVEPGHRDAFKRLVELLQKLGKGKEVIRLFEKALAQRPSAELLAQFRGLTVLARGWAGRCPTAPADRLLFDGTHYYTYDPEGNRTSRYRKDARGNQFDLTTYVWNQDNELTAVNGGGAQVDFSGNALNLIASPTNVKLFVERTKHDDPSEEITIETGSSTRPRFSCAEKTSDMSAGLCYYTPRWHDSGGSSAHPPISVIMPVFNGARSLDRAIRSVVEQTFPEWELMTVDDGSSDDSRDMLKVWAERDPRIHVICRSENGGVSAARNLAIQNARGRFVTYLDYDDEYYLDYLANVVRLIVDVEADVLMFGYDFIYEDGPADSRLQSWDPALARRLLFTEVISTPLGVAHRRALWEKVGGFNQAWCEEDGDLWRRMARAGAEFTFLPLKSGRYHVRRDSASRVPHLTPRQKEMFLENWRQGRPLYWVGKAESEISNLRSGDSPHTDSLAQATAVGGTRRPSSARCPSAHATTHHAERDEYKEHKRKVAFVSPHSVLDFTNGAATATLDGLTLLARSGFECHAFCSTRMDAAEEVLVEEILAQRRVPYLVRNIKLGEYQARMIFTSHNGIPVTLFNTASTRGGCTNAEEIAAFLAACAVAPARWTVFG